MVLAKIQVLISSSAWNPGETCELPAKAWGNGRGMEHEWRRTLEQQSTLDVWIQVLHTALLPGSPGIPDLHGVPPLHGQGAGYKHLQGRHSDKWQISVGTSWTQMVNTHTDVHKANGMKWRQPKQNYYGAWKDDEEEKPWGMSEDSVLRLCVFVGTFLAKTLMLWGHIFPCGNIL